MPTEHRAQVNIIHYYYKSHSFPPFEPQWHWWPCHRFNVVAANIKAFGAAVTKVEILSTSIEYHEKTDGCDHDYFFVVQIQSRRSPPTMGMLVTLTLTSQAFSLETSDATEKSIRLKLIHDSNGRIESLIAYPHGAPEPFMQLGPGQYTALTDVPAGSNLDLTDCELDKRLDELIKAHRVDVGSPQCRLVAQ